MNLVEIPAVGQRSVAGMDGRATGKPEIRAAIDDVEHHVCNVTLSSDTRAGGVNLKRTRSRLLSTSLTAHRHA